EAFGRAVGHAQQRRVAVRVPAVHDAVAEGDAGRPRDAETLHLLAGDGVGLDVDRVEPDPPRREQLLRLGAGGAAGAGVEARLHRMSLYPTRDGTAASALPPLRLGARPRGAAGRRGTPAPVGG